MKAAHLTPPRLAGIVARFPAARVAVVGDFFLDKYLEVDPRLEEVSVETGKPAHQVVGVRCSPGAAGTVMSNLSALGAGALHAVGFTGDDGEGFELRRGLRGLGCSVDHLHVAAERRTPTYLKPRDALDPTLEGEHSRYDTKNRRPAAEETSRRILESIESLIPEIDALVVMDQVEEDDCGVVTGAVRGALCRLAERHRRAVFWADSRRRIHLYRGLIIKPNQLEAVGSEPGSLPTEDAELAALRAPLESLRARNRAPVVVTRGARGAIVSDPEWTLVPGVELEGAIDPTGAGDSATAGAVLALCAGAELP
ncbi:MAG: carbohydrate kinase, partial [Planctomycetes bacterium]|nr:carbohydrate kinase [Planctomycetota bacterium]